MKFPACLKPLLLTCVVLPGLAAAAGAADQITVLADQSQVIKLDKTPGTIVVGNPSITDVTIQGNQLFLHGRAFGKTNIIVLDENGSQIAEYNVNVAKTDDFEVTVFKGNTMAAYVTQSTLTCETVCEAALHIGDDPTTFKNIHEQQKNKLGIAQDQKPGESPTPGTPDQSQ